MLQTRARVFVASPTGRLAVKVCGIMRPEQSLLAASYGADMIGMVFASSKRQVSIEQAKLVRMALDGLSHKPLLVGVFVNETPTRMREIAFQVGLDVLQLSGDESPAVVRECLQYLPVIKGMRFSPGTPVSSAQGALGHYNSLASGGDFRLLIDTFRPGEYGGTGQLADLALASALSSQQNIILAGGLNPINVRGAIKTVRPWGVDVSSGVEREGMKDPALITEFIRAARQG